MPDGQSASSLLTPREPPLVSAPVEQALLGILLSRVEMLDVMPAALRPETFGVEPHSDVMRQIIAVRDAVRQGAVLLQVAQALAPDDTDLREYLAGLLSAPVSFLHDDARSYADVLVDLARKRALFAMMDELRSDLLHRPDMPAQAMMSRTLARLDLIAAGQHETRPLVTMDEALDEALAAADLAAENGGVIGLSTGMPGVDNVLGGLVGGELVLIAGRPGMGKSALGWQWAVNVALQCRARPEQGGVFGASLEMKSRALAARALASHSGVDNQRLRQGTHGDYRHQLNMARAELDGLPLVIEDANNLTMAQIRLRAREARRRFGRLALIVIDHLHIVEPEQVDLRQRNETWIVGRMSNGAKAMAKEFDCPVLALAQLSRKLEERDDKRPLLSDLRQAGNLEQDADSVCFVYRQEYYLPTSAPEQKAGEGFEAHQARVRAWDELRANSAGRADLIFAKVRDGSPATIKMRWIGETTTFEDRE
jgi:replicative DNA helicase